MQYLRMALGSTLNWAFRWSIVSTTGSSMRIPSRRSKYIVSSLVIFFTVATLCPFAVGDTLQAAGAPELTSGQDMDAMACGASACRSTQISTIRQDSFQTIQDVLGHSTAATFGSAVLPEPPRIRGEAVRDRVDLRPVQRVPLYILHASLIR